MVCRVPLVSTAKREIGTTMNLQVCDINDSRHMGSDDLGDDFDPEMIGEYAETLDRSYALAYHFSEGDRYELRVWDEDDVVWSAEYTYQDGALIAD
jgi:hypothetical protein